MRVAVRPPRMVVVSLLVMAASCASPEPEIHSVLVIDALRADASAAPIDLEQSATAQGCATDPIWSDCLIKLTVHDVVSAREFIVTGRYGRERIRPWLEAGTVARLQGLRAPESEIVERLKRELCNGQLLEPASSVVPPVTADGLRIAILRTSDLKPLDSVVNSILDQWPAAESGEPPSFEDVDLAVVPRDSESLQERVRVAVSEAERWSTFRAAPGLVVEWGDSDDVLDAFASWLDEQHESGPCVDLTDPMLHAEGEVIELGPPWGVSLLGGRIFIQEGRDWRELYLHWVLLHELMHQHQFAMCAQGVELKSVPALFSEAHASSLAIEILERQGLSEAALGFVRECDYNGGATRAFDDLREQLGLGADECLRYLASHPDQAERVRSELDGPKLWANLTGGEAPAIPTNSLSFECAPAEGLVTIINESDSPFSGSSDGWWYSKSAGADARQRQRGDAPFALRLPPQGRVTLKLHHALAPDADPATCFTVFRRTPAPVFGPSAGSSPAGSR